jgi:hypothetical protein
MSILKEDEIKISIKDKHPPPSPNNSKTVTDRCRPPLTVNYVGQKKVKRGSKNFKF